MAQRQLLSSRERSDFLSGLATNDLPRLQERRTKHEEMIEKAEAEGNAQPRMHTINLCQVAIHIHTTDRGRRADGRYGYGRFCAVCGTELPPLPVRAPR